MRNKTGIIILTVVITALCLFYLSFTLVSRGIQRDAEEYATDSTGKIDFFKKQEYLDSLWNLPVYNFLGIEFTYKQVKESELNLGLDLRGGMHVTLEISPVEILTGLAGNTPDPNFKEAINRASQAQGVSQKTFTTEFFNAYRQLSPGTPLASVFATPANKGRINFDTDDAEVIKVIDSEVEGAIDRTFNIIRTRIDKFGVSQPIIQRVPGTGRIQIELPGVDNPQRIRRLLQGVAKLEFLEVWDVNEYIPYIYQINDYLVKKNKQGTPDKDDLLVPAQPKDDLFTTTEEGEENLTGDVAAVDSMALADSLMNALAGNDNEVSDLLRLAVQNFGGLAYQVQDTGRINKLLQDPAVMAMLPPNMRFAWAVKPQSDQSGKPTTILPLYALKRNRSGNAPLTGEAVVEARQSFDQFGRPDISMQMNVEGAKRWKKLTSENVGRQIAIVLDNYVYSAPVVQGEIPNGSSSITGNFTIEEAQDLANVLKAGKLPASPRIVEEVVVGPSLGIEAQKQGIISVVVGLGMVVVFMVLYYAKGGLVANAALLINIFFIFGILAQLGAALTLPGIAGIVLTIGMSIDANVLIFERIREELRKEPGNLLNAINQGYDRAFWTIFDSNITTLLTGIFLYSFGTGPVKGFAVTLMIGIACSFFSAVFITRVIVSWLTAKGNSSKISFETPFANSILKAPAIDFLSKRKVAYIISASVIVIGLGTMLTKGLNLGVDFEGGRSYIVEFSKRVVETDLEVALRKELNNASVEVKTFGSDQKMKITTNYMVDDNTAESDSVVLDKLVAGISAFTQDTYEPADELMGEGKFIIPSTSKVGSTIADDLIQASESAVLFSLIAIFLYIWVRFRNWKFGLGAIVALFHDAFVVLSIYAIASNLGLSIEVDQVFVAALLTVIGYSINDTVVVFDRVREFLNNRGASSEYKQTINDSINSTLNRTLVTSFTTLLVVLILFLFGGEVLRGFSFALLVGIMVGTYSSIFVATPVVYDTANAEEKRRLKKEGKASVKTA